MAQELVCEAEDVKMVKECKCMGNPCAGGVANRAVVSIESA